MKTRQPRGSAFTILELLVAVALFAVAAGGLLSLFPVAHLTDQESEEETRASLIAAGIFDAMDPGCGSLRIASGVAGGIPRWETLPAGNPNRMTVAYDSACEPLRILTPSEAEAPLADIRIRSVVTVITLPGDTVQGLMKAEVRVASPPSAPHGRRRERCFVRIFSVPWNVP
jgi:hypothetical protein